MPIEDHTDYQDNRFFSRSNTAHFGRVTIPFPFSAIIGIVALPLLFVGAGLSLPFTAVRRFVVNWREEKFRRKMSRAGRTISWPDAVIEVERSQGTFVVEYISAKGPSRLWVTSDDLAQTSPSPCCFEMWPWPAEVYRDFFRWCGARYTASDHGLARLVEIKDVPYETLSATLDCSRTNKRCVSIVRLPENS